MAEKKEQDEIAILRAELKSLREKVEARPSDQAEAKIAALEIERQRLKEELQRQTDHRKALENKQPVKEHDKLYPKIRVTQRHSPLPVKTKVYEDVTAVEAVRRFEKDNAQKMDDLLSKKPKVHKQRASDVNNLLGQIRTDLAKKGFSEMEGLEVEEVLSN